MKIFSLILAALIPLGCGTKEPIAINNPLTTDLRPPSQDLTTDQTVLEAAHVDTQSPSVRLTSPPGTSATGIISREGLNVILAAGPAAILAAVVTEPVRENGRFIGFKITRFTDRAPQTIDLRAGDIILRANGRTIERPENYFAVFEDLKIANQLRLDVLRNGEFKTLVYPIQDTSDSDTIRPSRTN